jgi:RNA polymerase sigma-70 factor (ECF subfamily)
MTKEELPFLIEGCKKNDRESQRKLYNYFFKDMYSYVSKYIEDPDKAEEVLNDGFLRIFSKIHLYSYKGSLEGWIRRIMHNSVCNYVRSNKKHDVVRMVDSFYDVVEKYSDTINFKYLLKLIDELPNKTKTAFLMFIEGTSHSEISKTLGMSEGTSKWHISEARSILQKKILQNQKVYATTKI